MATMKETYYDQPADVPVHMCDWCGETPRTQIYVLRQIRENMERVWFFCSTACIRKWSKPTR